MWHLMTVGLVVQAGLAIVMAAPIGSATPVVTTCAAVPAYADAVVAAFPPRSPTEDRLLKKWLRGEITFATARPSEAALLSHLFDDYATALEQFPEAEVPEVVRAYHDAMIGYYSAQASGYNAAAHGDLTSTTAYAKQAQDWQADATAGWDHVNARCDNLELAPIGEASLVEHGYGVLHHSGRSSGFPDEESPRARYCIIHH